MSKDCSLLYLFLPQPSLSANGPLDLSWSPILDDIVCITCETRTMIYHDIIIDTSFIARVIRVEILSREIPPRFKSSMKLLFWAKDVEWVKVLIALGLLCLWQCLIGKVLNFARSYVLGNNLLNALGPFCLWQCSFGKVLSFARSYAVGNKALNAMGPFCLWQCFW